METSREDVGIAIRSAFLRTDTKQRFSLFFLVLFSIILLFFEKIETKPLNYVRSFVKDLTLSCLVSHSDFIISKNLEITSPFLFISFLNTKSAA